MEDSFWNSFPLFSPQEPVIQQENRFTFVAPDEDVWIPSDQTIHWGKRPNSIYPFIEIQKKEDLPPIPRGSRLVAKMLSAEWAWDDAESARISEIDPISTRCLEDDKIIIPFEKGVAVFRHLRVSKNIKLRGLASFTIRSLDVEIGYHNPYSETSFKTLDIILRKDVKIHIVAHKGSVGFMKKHGLAKVAGSQEAEERVATLLISRNCDKRNRSSKSTSEEPVSISVPLPTSTQIPLPSSQDAMMVESQALVPFQPSGDGAKAMSELATLKRSADTTLEQLSQLSQLKKQKTSQLTEILDELAGIQNRTESLKKRIADFLTTPLLPPDKTIQITAPPHYSPTNFIFYAFRIRDLELGINLIKNFNFDLVNTRDQKGYTLLHTAAKSGFLEGVQYCLEQGANPNAKTNHRSTALHFAYQRNNTAMIQLLKQYNADENVVNVYGLKPKDYQNQRKPLPNKSEGVGCVEVVMPGYERPFKLSVWFAARIGWLEVVTLYVSHLGWDVDTKTADGVTPLMCACEYNRTNVVEYLLQVGADPNARDIHDKTPLHYAYVNYNQDIIRLLEQNGADSALNNIWNHQPSWYKDTKVLV